MSEKVKLPRKVAKEIEFIRKSMCPSNQDVIIAATSCNVTANPALQQYAKSNFDELLDALVNDYEVEQTPEDKVRERYENIDPNTPCGGGSRHAIRDTLNALNIKISGVNAE